MLCSGVDAAALRVELVQTYSYAVRALFGDQKSMITLCCVPGLLCSA
jgi:hypothetical protein